MAILNVFAILVAGLMVGSELAIAAFVHPTLVRLSDMFTCQLQALWRACRGDSCRFGTSKLHDGWYILLPEPKTSVSKSLN